jgi:rhodanese-related sulfurtransferase
MDTSKPLKLTIFITCIVIQTLTHAQIQHVTIEVFKSGLENADVQLIDVRTLEEFNAGHLEGAIQIDFYSENFVSDILKLDKSKPIYVYCGTGSRSLKASNLFKENGFTVIVDMAGGYNHWVRAQYPVVY